jgi:hypothetical protein
MNNLHEYQDIISHIKKLEGIKPSKEFKSRVDLMLSTNIQPSSRQVILASPFRLVAFSVLLFFISGVGVVGASEQSQPGSLLYPVKKAVREVRLALETNPRSRAILHIQKAEDNLKEIKQSVESNNNNRLEQNVNRYQENVNKAFQESQKSKQQNNTINRMEQSAGKQREVLQQIENRAPQQAQPALNRAIEASEKNQQEVRGAEIIDNQPETQNGQGNNEAGKGNR